jgi:glycosyltransferase involved in cell wall biosynthesis
MTGPLISVIIPVYNGERYLAEAIESVLAQTYRPIEVIVVDDGSTDGSARVAQQWAEVRYHSQPHSGAAAARNYGVQLAQGDLFAFLDADDLWVQDKLERQVVTLREHPELDMVFGYVEQFHSPELDENTRQRLKGAGQRMVGYHIGTMLIRREAFLGVGLFSEQWQVADFIDWYARAMETGIKSMVLPAVLMKRRLHSQNLGVRQRDSVRSVYTQVLKTALDRRRRDGEGGRLGDQ